MCTQCTNISSSLNLLSDHKNEYHLKFKKENQHKNTTCDKCERTFYSKQTLQDHIIIHHTNVYPHLCDHCGKGFTVKQFSQLFEKHRETCIIGKKPRRVPEKVCTECGKSFINLTKFKRHMVFHTKAKDFQCSDCEKAFADKLTLKKHVIRLHPSIANQFDRVKNKPCDLCDKYFVTKTEVEHHKIEEHGQSYFKLCDTCGKGFIKKAYKEKLKNHKKKGLG